MRSIDADALERALGYLWVVTTSRDTDDKETSLERAAMCRGIDVCIGIVQRAPTIGGWISVEDRLPEEGVRVLAVKKLKDGRRDLALASCIPEYKHHDYTTGEDIVEPYWVCGGNNNITHWAPLPELPEEGS